MNTNFNKIKHMSECSMGNKDYDFDRKKFRRCFHADNKTDKNNST